MDANSQVQTLQHKNGTCKGPQREFKASRRNYEDRVPPIAANYRDTNCHT